MQHHYEGHWKGWALDIETFLGPEMARAKQVPFGPKNVVGSFMYPSAVVYCCCVLLCVVVSCCVLEGRGGLLVAVLCEQVGAGWQASPSPTHYSVGIHGCMLVGGGVL